MSDKCNLETKSDCLKAILTCLTSKQHTKKMKLAFANRDGQTSTI